MLSNQIKQTAAQWFLKMQEAALDAPERSTFEAWLLSDPLHGKAYKLVEETMHDFDSAERLGALSSALSQKRLFEKSQRGKKIAKFGSNLVLAMVFIGTSWLGYYQYEAWQAAPVMQAAQSTQIAQMVTHTLEDGSKITLNSDSNINITYYRKSRVVHLQRGEAIFDVAKDAARPFIVETDMTNAGTAKITVLGTRFAVNKLENLLRVSVDHGRVQVSTSPQQTVILTAGQVAEIKLNQAPQLVNRNAADAFSFKDGFINFDRADMDEVAETLSRYRKPAITAQFKANTSPHVSAAFKIKDTNQFIESLPITFPVTITHTPQQTIIRQK